MHSRCSGILAVLLAILLIACFLGETSYNYTFFIPKIYSSRIRLKAMCKISWENNHVEKMRICSAKRALPFLSLYLCLPLSLSRSAQCARIKRRLCEESRTNGQKQYNSFRSQINEYGCFHVRKLSTLRRISFVHRLMCVLILDLCKLLASHILHLLQSSFSQVSICLFGCFVDFNRSYPYIHFFNMYFTVYSI